MLTDNQRAALAARLRNSRDGQAQSIPPRPADKQELPLSFAQEQLWFLNKLAPGQPTYNVPQALRILGPLDVQALTAALTALVARHEALRTKLATNDQGHPVQVVDPAGPFPLSLTDLSGSSAARMRQLASAEAMQPFAVSGGALFRGRLVRLAEDRHVLLVIAHHLVFDGWSAKILLRDLAALYREQVTGEPSGLAKLPIQFADYALWERARPDAGQPELERYWHETLADAPTVRFPTDRPRPVTDTSEGAIAEHLIDIRLLDQLRELAQRSGSTLFVVLLSALEALLYRYTGQTDLVVGTVTANRRRPELADVIGFLVNTLPIRTDISGDPPFSELIELVRHSTISAYAHQDLPFAKIVAASRVPRDPSRTPLFQITLTYADRDEVTATAGGTQLALDDLIVGIPAAKFDLDFSIESRPSGLWIECCYKTALFDAERIARLLAHLEHLLRSAARDPAARLSELPMLTTAELHHELTSWNPVPAPVPPGCVHEAFERQAAATPQATAIEFGEERVSYADLNRQADRLAARLRTAGVGPEALVGVSMPTSPRRLATLIAIWKAGGGYLPLDPALPADRLAFMIGDAEVTVIVTDDASAASLPSANATILNLDAHRPVDQAADQSVIDRATPENVAYVIYTSGSTGQPKGVVVEHRQAISYLASTIDHLQVGPGDAVLQFSSLSFDASVQEMFMPLLAGGRVVLAEPAILHSPRRLRSLLSEGAVTIAAFTPSVLNLLDPQDLAHLRVLICGGEELPSELAARWLRPGLRFINDYGPTETTVSATCHELTVPASSRPPLGPPTTGPPPIGLPLRHVTAYLLDRHQNQVPVGVTGELYVGGTGVARGYLNRPGLTAQCFIPDPFRSGGRLYRTGDLCYRRPDGALVFAGRADQQVKLRGLRIELGEIESVLAACAQVREATVKVFPHKEGEKIVVAYMSPQATGDLDLTEVRAHLSAVLPSYMVPGQFVVLPSLPLTVSGKVDRQALPAPAQPTPALDDQPATGAEAVLAELFASVLGTRRFGPGDDFFASGGNSLQAMRLVDLIGARTGCELAPASVFLYPTPRDLAAHLTPAGPASRSSLIPLSAELDRPPLILIHAIGGTVFAYSQLAVELASAFTVLGLEAPALTQPDLGKAPASIADLSTWYVELIRASQPDGPYRLGGWSMGGVLAYEIACRLEARGDTVALLALLDPPYAVPAGGELTGAQLAAQFVVDAAASLGLDAHDRPDPSTASTAAQLAWLASAIGDADPALAGQLSRRLEVFTRHSRLLAGYRPGPGSHTRAPTVLISAGRSLNASASSSWRPHLDGPIRQLTLDCDHYEFLRPPLSAKVATAISERSEADAAAKPGAADW